MVFDAILTSEITVFEGCGNPIANNFFVKSNCTQFVNRNVKILGDILWSPSLKDVAWLEDAQLFF